MKYLLALLILSLLPAMKLEAQTKPEFKGSTLRVVRPGKTETLRIFGENLAPDSVTVKSPLKARIVSANATEKAEKSRGSRVVLLEVTVPEKATPESSEVVLNQGKERISFPIMVIEPVEFKEIKEPPLQALTAPLLTSGVGVMGTVPPDRCAYYRFEAKAGETWEVRVRAGRLGSALDTIVRLRDSHRITLAMGAGDERKDRSLTFHAKLAGTYTLEIYDADMRGGAEYNYQLSLWRQEMPR